MTNLIDAESVAQSMTVGAIARAALALRTPGERFQFRKPESSRPLSIQITFGQRERRIDR